MAKVSTPIKRRNYNNRGMIDHHFVNDPCKIASDGTLWAMICYSDQAADLYKSDDNGFSWQRLESNQFWPGYDTRAIAGLDVEGPISHIEIIPDMHVIFVLSGAHDYLGNYHCWFSVYDYTTNTLVKTGTQIGSDNEQLQSVYSSCAYNKQVFHTSVNGTSYNLQIRRISPRTYAVSGATTESSFTYDNRYDTVCDGDGHVDVIVQAATTPKTIKHIRFDDQSISWGSVHSITSLASGEEIASIAISRDGYGILCAVYSVDTGSETTFYWAYSTDNGSTWTVNQITGTKLGGSSEYQDNILSERDGRVDIIGGLDGGFLISYVRDNASGIPRAYMNYISTSDGSSYTLEDPVEATGANSSASIVGVRFFKPEADGMPTLGNKGFIRIAYQNGEGNDTTQYDTTPVDFDQERLEETAYPIETTGSYSSDSAGSGELEVTLNIIGGPNDNIDFYVNGFIGENTTQYLNAFNKIGNPVEIYKYEPDEDSIMADRSSYQQAVAYTTRIILDPASYSFPTPSIAAADFTDWIEQDIRIIYLSPDFHLSRTFIVNDGGFLKRTVWTVQYDGNEYEISQVVPFFIDGEICLYRANAYVIGPSRDPWARTILPSET